ncbi:MAG: ArnT family glycosyltransferase [Paracoccaceae bacterium]
MNDFARVETALAGLAQRRGLLPMLFIALFATLMFLPGFFTVPPIDRDETRFSQASRQMVASGDLIDIRLGEGTRYKKPVGIYWLQSAAVSLVGPEHAKDIWAYRLPSLVAAVAACLLTYLIALSLVNAQAAFIAALLMAVCFVLNGEARLAKTDATLLASILAAQLVLARLQMQGALGRMMPWLFWAALGVSALVKGPIGPMVVGLTVLALCLLRREVSWLSALRPGWGVLLFVLIVAPWYVAITVKAGNAFWDEALGRDLLGKIGQGQESHGAPPGAFTAAVWFTFWPASILLPFGIWFAWRERQEAAVLFCLAWWLPSWLVFEMTATKLIHYVLPTFPAIAILCAAGWQARPEGRPGLIYSVFLAVFLALALVLAAVPAGFQWDRGAWPAWPWYVGLAISTIGIWFAWTRVRTGDRILPVVGLGLLWLGLAFSLFSNLARFAPLWPSVALADMAQSVESCDAPLLVSLGYQEESLMLLTDNLPVFVHDADSALAAIADRPCALVFADAPHQAAFEAGLVEHTVETVGTFQGFSIGGADEVDIKGYLIRPE